MELLESSGHDEHDEHSEDEHDDEHEDEDHHDEDEHHDDEHEDEHDDEHEGKEHNDVHDKDPHVWLGKENIITISETIRDELTKIMPEQAEYFSENAENFETELEKIYSDFALQTDGKTPKEFIVFHDAYNYLMESIGMDLNLKVPFSENVLLETGTAHMAELVGEIENHGVKHIFREPQFSDGALQKFVDEHSLILGTLDPLGTDPSANGHLDNIRSNLEALSKVYE
jgi:zinc transport system substrate-binding protein